MKSKKTVAICTISDISTDYRLHKMAMTISKNNLTPYFITRRRKGHLNESKKFTVKILNLVFEKGPFFYLEYNIRIFFFLLFNTPDIIFSVDLDTLAGTRLASFLLRRPIIFDSHEYFPESPELQHRLAIKKIWQINERIFVPTIKYGITVCDSIAEIYKQKYGKTFKVIRNLPLTDNDINSYLDLTQSKDNKNFTLIYQGAINIGRGILEIIESLQYVNNVNLIIVGDGDIYDEVVRLISKLNLSTRVKLTGKVPFHDLGFYTNQADLGLILLENMGMNYYFSLPNRVFDFIKHKVPILAIDFPEIKNVVEGYDVGYCVSNLNPKYLAETIVKIRNDKERIEQWKLNAEKASRELTWEKDEIYLSEILKEIS